MLRYLGRRAKYSVIVLAVVIVIVFFIFYVLGDPTDQLLPDTATPEQRDAFRHQMGFADPILVQFARFVGHVVTLNFGQSYAFHTAAMPLVLSAVPYTLLLAAAGFVIAFGGGILLGAVAGLREGSAVDRAIVIFATAAASLAQFWVGLVLIQLLSVELGWLPTSGFGAGSRLIMPAVTLALPGLGRITVVFRTNVIEARRATHIPPAFARGIALPTLLLKHVLRNASVPTVALAGIELTQMVVGGAVVVETVFAWPGVGRLYVSAMDVYDLPVVSAALVLGGVFVLVLNVLLDLLYVALDPRVTLGGVARRPVLARVAMAKG